MSSDVGTVGHVTLVSITGIIKLVPYHLLKLLLLTWCLGTSREKKCYISIANTSEIPQISMKPGIISSPRHELILVVKETERWHAPVHHFLVLTFDFSVGAGIPWWISEGSRSEVAHVCGQSHGRFVGGGGDRAAAWFWLCKRHATCSPRHLHTFAYMCTCVHGTVTEHMTSWIHVHKISAQEWQDKWCRHYIDGLVQDCSNSIANALELLQSCP